MLLCMSRVDGQDGEVVGINYSTHSRDSFMALALDDVAPFYNALSAFTRLLYHPHNILVVKLQPGVKIQHFFASYTQYLLCSKYGTGFLPCL